MSKEKPTNVAASIRQKLLNLSHSQGRPFDEVLQFYAMERFLYRISLSEHNDKLILKGALMLIAWQAPSSRPTADLDFLGRHANDPEAIVAMVKKICSEVVEDDGLTFSTESIAAELITEDADYQGVRVRFMGTLENARIPMQLDIGFGDILLPGPLTMDYPTLLNLPKPVIYGYTRESSIAEKLEAMVKLGIANSRMKDFYDIWYLSRWFDFDSTELARAITATFNKRGTKLSQPPMIFSAEFTENSQKQLQWSAFVKKSGLAGAPATMGQVIQELKRFLLPIIDAVVSGESVRESWSPKDGWQKVI